jgi:hypothetical protein
VDDVELGEILLRKGQASRLETDIDNPIVARLELGERDVDVGLFPVCDLAKLLKDGEVICSKVFGDQDKGRHPYLDVYVFTIDDYCDFFCDSIYNGLDNRWQWWRCGDGHFLYIRGLF